MLKILILGANGFIGRNLKEHLSLFPNKYYLVAPSRNELNLLNEESVKNFLNKQCFDAVINAAICNPVRGHELIAQSELEKDLRIFFNLQKYSNLYGKMLYFGSGAEFDKSKPIISVKEEDFYNNIPKNQYGLAKYIIGKNIEKSDNIYNLRIFGLFGKYENWRTTFISGACCKAIKGIPITIRQNVFFDYMYIDDFCNIIRWFVDNKPKYHTYNIATGAKIDLIGISKIINSLIIKKVPIYICKPGLANEYTADNKRLINEVKSTQITDWNFSIKSLLEYYKKNEKFIDLYSLLYQK